MTTTTSSPTRGVKPQQPAPPLAVRLTGGETWTLAEQRPDAFTMVLFYRGLHCPVCQAQLREIGRRVDELTERGIEPIAISGDTEARALEARREWGLDRLRVGFGLDEAAMREWGLFVSAAIKDGEPALFNEPGLFLVRPDGSVFYEAITSMPWGRPRLDDVLGGVDFVIEQDYPARGEA